MERLSVDDEVAYERPGKDFSIELTPGVVVQYFSDGSVSCGTVRLSEPQHLSLRAIANTVCAGLSDEVATTLSQHFGLSDSHRKDVFDFAKRRASDTNVIPKLLAVLADPIKVRYHHFFFQLTNSHYVISIGELADLQLAIYHARFTSFTFHFPLSLYFDLNITRHSSQIPPSSSAELQMGLSLFANSFGMFGLTHYFSPIYLLSMRQREQALLGMLNSPFETKRVLAASMMKLCSVIFMSALPPPVRIHLFFVIEHR